MSAFREDTILFLLLLKGTLCIQEQHIWVMSFLESVNQAKLQELWTESF